MSKNRRQKEQRRNRGIHTLLTRESDRGCVLVAAAMLDELLADLFRKFLRPGTADELLKQGSPLGFFSSRIQMAYAMGIINKEARDDLEIIRRIRNDAAHFERKRGDGYKTGFDSSATIQRVRQMSWVKNGGPTHEEEAAGIQWRWPFVAMTAMYIGLFSCRIESDVNSRMDWPDDSSIFLATSHHPAASRGPIQGLRRSK